MPGLRTFRHPALPPHCWIVPSNTAFAEVGLPSYPSQFRATIIMSSSSGNTHNERVKTRDFVNRGVKKPNWLGTATFFGLRAADPYLQYGILSQGWGDRLVEKLGGGVLPKGPSLITNTPLDNLGLSPYRSILFGMSVGSMVKQNFHLLGLMQEQITPTQGAAVGVFNAISNSLNSLFFICSQTSASVNGEHFPQTPLIVGSILYGTGLFVEWYAELQRGVWKRKPENKGKIYKGGLFGLSRHINYFGYTMWRTGYALAAGGWLWGMTVAALSTYGFTQRAIPDLQYYLENKVRCQCLLKRVRLIKRLC